MNQITITGNVGKDPEFRYSSTGTPVANINVGVSRKNGDHFETSWFAVRAFKDTANFIGEHVNKGDRVMVSGSMIQDHYTDKEGKNQAYWRLYANEVAIKPKTLTPTMDGKPADDEEIPF